jgi:hypothetical protein
MTKEEALNKIKELQCFVEEIDKPNPERIKLVVGRGDNGVSEYNYKNNWIFSVITDYDEGCFYKGSIESGSSASIYFRSNMGKWLNEDGEVIKGGYLYFKPKK